MHRRTSVALAATAALGVSVVAVPALAGAQAPTTPTIQAVGQSENTLAFSPKTITVKSGSSVTFTNASVAPHTLSLVKKPLTAAQMKGCENPTGKSPCTPLIKAHKVNLKSGRIGQQAYDARSDFGFATPGTNKKAGDSIYRDPGKSFTFTVTAKAGKTLNYFCAIHPFMRGKIKVVK
jgi:plastocyanin